MSGTLSALSSKLAAVSTLVGRAIDHFFDLAFLRVLCVPITSMLNGQFVSARQEVSISRRTGVRERPSSRSLIHGFAIFAVVDSFDCLFLFKEHSHHGDASLHGVHGGKDWS
jgi:uncharacterized protein YqgC (DUF456 family)